MNVGIIGACGFGRHHAEAFEQIGCRVVAMADVAAGVNEVAERFSATAYRDYRELLKHPNLQAVSISLPPRLHPAAVSAALAQGLPVLCEKPIAASLKEAEALVREVGIDAPVAVGFTFRYNVAYQRLRELIRSGEFGRVRTILARKCWGTRTSWRLEQGGGAVFVKDIHYFDLIPWLLDDEPRDLCAFGGSFYYGGEVEDSYQLLMNFPGGTTFQLDSAWWTVPDSVSSFEVVSEQARILVEEGILRIVSRESRVERVTGEPMLVAEIRAFADWQLRDGFRPPGLAEALRANQLAQQVRDVLRHSKERRG
jgi:predicted dehydrogenase